MTIFGIVSVVEIQDFLEKRNEKKEKHGGGDTLLPLCILVDTMRISRSPKMYIT